MAAFRGRVVQAALKVVLEPISEGRFQPCSYGFRPERRCQGAWGHGAGARLSQDSRAQRPRGPTPALWRRRARHDPAVPRRSSPSSSPQKETSGWTPPDDRIRCGEHSCGLAGRRDRNGTNPIVRRAGWRPSATPVGLRKLDRAASAGTVLLIWRAFCQGGNDDFHVLCLVFVVVVGWVGGGPAGCARRAVRLIYAGWYRRTMVRRGEAAV